MDRGAWWTAVYGIAKSWKGLSVHMQITCVFYFLIPQTFFSLCNFMVVSLFFSSLHLYPILNVNIF